MHGSAQGQDDVADLPVDAGFLGGFHVGGDGGNGGAGAEGHGSGLKQVLPHNLGSALAAAEAGIDGEENKHVRKAQAIVDDQGLAVIADEIRAVGGNQIGEEAQKADGSVVSNDLHRFQNAAGHVLQKLGGHGICAALHLHAEAHDHRKHDQRQDGTAAEQLHKVGLGKEIDDHIADAQNGAGVRFRYIIVAGDHRKYPHNHIHNDGGNARGDHEGSQGHTHNLTGSLGAGHIGDGGGDGGEHHGNHRAEHQVREDGAQRFQGRSRLGEQQTDDAAGHDADQHTNQKSVVLEELFHDTYSLSK